MALVTIDSIYSAPSSASNHPGPFRDGNGNLYVVVLFNHNLKMRKSTDGGSTWNDVDFAGRPNYGSGNNLGAFAAVQDGTTIHVAAHWTFPGGKTQNVLVGYNTFHTSDAGVTPDEWVIGSSGREVIGTFDVGDAADVTEAAGIEIAVRSDGDVIVFHPGSHNTDMGTEYFNLSYSRREGGSWTTDIALSTEADNQYHPRAVMAPNDECHFTYARTGTAASFAATIDSANSISTRVSYGGGGATQVQSGRPITWDNGGTQQILVGLYGGAVGDQVRRMQEDGSGDIATDLAADTPPDAAISSIVNRGFAWDSVNEEAYVFWRRNSDGDLMYDKGSHGTSWGTDVEQEDAVTINGVWTNYYNETIGYVVLDVTTLKYGELDLSTAAVTRLPFARRQLTTVRM